MRIQITFTGPQEKFSQFLQDIGVKYPDINLVLSEKLETTQVGVDETIALKAADALRTKLRTVNPDFEVHVKSLDVGYGVSVIIPSNVRDIPTILISEYTLRERVPFSIEKTPELPRL